jgi:hypothetical protein
VQHGIPTWEEVLENILPVDEAAEEKVM